MKKAAHKLRIRVGNRLVDSRSIMFPKCDSCGYYELSAEHLRQSERRAALTVLRDAETVSGAVLRFSRKALGLKQDELAELLSYTAETISRFETDARDAPQVYRLALAELLARELRGGDFALEPNDGDPTPATPERISRTG
ncbi:MAG TPA: helix-turn-helix domain-containing protein [Polyangiaceae bacterium]